MWLSHPYGNENLQFTLLANKNQFLHACFLWMLTLRWLSVLEANTWQRLIANLIKKKCVRLMPLLSLQNRLFSSLLMSPAAASTQRQWQPLSINCNMAWGCERPRPLYSGQGWGHHHPTLGLSHKEIQINLSSKT